MNNLINLLKYKYIWFNIILAVISILLAYSYNFLAPLFFIFITNVFDIYGYYFVLVHKKTIWPDDEIVKAYRIIQFMFDLSILSFIFVQFGPLQTSISLLLKMFGLQDLLYFLILQKKYPANWTWMGFTPIGLFVKKIPNTIIVLQGILALFIALIMNLIFY